MKMFIGSVVALATLASTAAVAENCPQDGRWTRLHRNMRWTAILDGERRGATSSTLATVP